MIEPQVVYDPARKTVRVVDKKTGDGVGIKAIVEWIQKAGKDNDRTRID